MPRYTSKQTSKNSMLSRKIQQLTHAARWAEDVPYLPDLEVISDGPVDTGLITAEGMKIWREPEPIGFPVGSSDTDDGRE